MANIEPHVEIYDVEKITQPTYGNAGKIALVGAFPTADFKLDLFTDLQVAKNALVGAYKDPKDSSIENANKDDVPAAYSAYYCLDYAFNNTKQSRGAESVVIVNTNYGKQTLVTESNNTDFANAFILLAEEDFDILNIAEPIALATTVNQTLKLNPKCETIKAFIDSQYVNQKPFGLITGFDLTDATAAIVQDFNELFADKGVYKAITTPVRVNGDAEPLSIAQSGSWHAAFTAGIPVNKSETAKVYEGINGENTKDEFPLTGAVTWKKLLDCGFHTTKYRNRRDGTIQCLSNTTPVGYDCKIERVKNYMIKRLTLADVLGNDNDAITRDYVRGIFEFEKNVAIQNRYLVDMEYVIKAVETDKVTADLKLYISDIIRVVVLNVSLEITAYKEE